MTLAEEYLGEHNDRQVVRSLLEVAGKCGSPPESIETIFYPGSPLHDMGVIIADGRIAAAGCQFPLAESGDVDASLGSRHRAALGLAQDSDAVVLVISEETGRVSVACEGQLYIGLEEEGLREMLISLLAPKALMRTRRRRVRLPAED